MAIVNLDTLVIHIIVNTIILSPVLWLAGRAIVGGERARFTDAILIIMIGTVIGTIFGAYFTAGFLASIIQLILWLLLVKHFFDCGWLKAFAISIFAVIIFIAIVIILGIIGFSLIPFIPW